MCDNLALWRLVEKTDPRATKQFSGKGGFKGTAISPMYMIKRATEQWGPMGGRWGVRVIQHQIIDGPGVEKLHVVLAEVWFMDELGNEHKIPAFGQTQVCGTRKDGTPFMDEEAPKKSLTDALTKGLSWLGFSADVHEGKFDDVKYVNKVNQDFQEKERKHNGKERAETLKLLGPAAEQGLEALVAAWKGLSESARASVKDDMPGLKVQAMEVDSAPH